MKAIKLLSISLMIFSVLHAFSAEGLVADSGSQKEISHAGKREKAVQTVKAPLMEAGDPDAVYGLESAILNVPINALTKKQEFIAGSPDEVLPGIENLKKVYINTAAFGYPVLPDEPEPLNEREEAALRSIRLAGTN